MTDITPTPAPATEPLLIETRWFPLSALLANLIAITVVNYWIYHARSVFIANHPEYVSQQPPTISRAISDPTVGPDFALWISGSAILLIFGILGLAMFYLRLASLLPSACSGLRRWIRILACTLIAVQVVACVGMYLLSNYRFPDGDELHMLGSYMLFIGEALAMVHAWLISWLVLRNKDQFASVSRTSPGVGMLRLRIAAGMIVLLGVVAYACLFVVKGIDLGKANEAIYLIYVLSEPAVISGFLAVFLLFQTDLWLMLRGRR